MPDRTVIVAGGDGGGQTHLREETTASELSLPVRQWHTLMKLRYLLVAACGGILLTWSPWSFLALGVAAISLLLVWRFDKDDEGWYWEWRVDDHDSAWLIRGFIAVCLLIVWLVLWDDILALAWPDKELDLILFVISLRFPWRLHIAWRILATAALSVPIWCYSDLAYRMRAEVTDPSWSAPIAPRAPDTGPAFPGAEIRSAGAEPAPPQIVEKPYPVPMPVPTRSGNHTMLPPEPVYDSGYKSVFAPSGREVSVNDLTTFIRLAPKITPASEVWKARGWQHPHWQDVVDVWAMFGVMAEREERIKTRILVEDFTEAMMQLSTWLNAPTPPED